MTDAAAPKKIHHDFVPETPEQLVECLASWEWRMFSGYLYKIMIKGDDGETVTSLPFIPNRAQRRFLKRLHTRNVILKARQLGFTTLIAILYLDHALFNNEQRCGMIAHTKEDAEVIFRDKVRYAYDNLPPAVRLANPLKRDSAQEILFANTNSSIRVATSVRSGTIHRLHVSEMGKIAAKRPDRAEEIVTGSLPAVPINGITVIESTAEGRGGEFYKIAERAEAMMESRKVLTPAEYRMHFYPWWEEPKYRMSPQGVVITAREHEYFDLVEDEEGCTIAPDQRAWYISQRDQTFSGDIEKMWREYPSTIEECWQRTSEGTFLKNQLALARSEQRITRIPFVTNVPVNTFWDIGSGAGSAIWLHQRVGAQDRFLDFIEDWDKSYEHYVKALREKGHIYGGHFLPHDATHVRQMKNTVAAPLDLLQELAPDWDFHIVPRVQTFQHGVDKLRMSFSTYYFDEVNCKEGLEHLKECRKKFNTRMQVYSDEPDKDNPHTEAFDALRQHAQGFDPALVSGQTRPTRRRSGRGGMTT